MPTRVQTCGIDGRYRVAIEPAEGFLETEISRTFDVIRALADAVRETAASGAVPVVFAVNCNTALGTVAGLETADDLGVVWFDGHADFSTPDNSPTGFIDGMGLNTLCRQAQEQTLNLGRERER